MIFAVLYEQNIFRIHNMQVSSNLDENILVLSCFAVIQGIRLLVQGHLIWINLTLSKYFFSFPGGRPPIKSWISCMHKHEIICFTMGWYNDFLFYNGLKIIETFVPTIPFEFFLWFENRTVFHVWFSSFSLKGTWMKTSKYCSPVFRALFSIFRCVVNCGDHERDFY